MEEEEEEEAGLWGSGKVLGDCPSLSFSTQVFHCLLSTDTLQFPVLVAQQSPAAVSMDTYCVSLVVQQAQVKEAEGGG